MGSDDQRPPNENESPDRDDGNPSETESVERYHRAHEVIERMRANKRPDRSGASDDDPRLDVTAALFRAAVPHAADVDPGFAARLLAQLETAQAAPPAPETSVATATPATVEAPAVQPSARRNGMSRRGLMLGGLGAAAAAVIGGAAGATIERMSQAPTQASGPSVTPHGVLGS